MVLDRRVRLVYPPSWYIMPPPFIDWESFVSFYDFPTEHWVHLRTTNPLESVFSGVRLRTDVAKRMKRRDSALYLVFKVALRLSERWKPLYGGRNLTWDTL